MGSEFPLMGNTDFFAGMECVGIEFPLMGSKFPLMGNTDLFAGMECHIN